MKNMALLAMALLVMGLPTVHFEHHLNLPVFDKYEIVESLKLSSHIYSKITDIRLNDTIAGENTVKNIVEVLKEAHKGDVVIFHLAGYGGEVETVYYIVNNIKSSKAHVIMSVEAPVYSGHAYLAVSGDELIMAPYTYLMFHTVSIYGQNCNSEKGTDRTVSNIEHCQIMYDNVMGLAQKFIINMPLLKASEKIDILTGHDVYLDSTEVQARLLVKGIESHA